MKLLDRLLEHTRLVKRLRAHYDGLWTDDRRYYKRWLAAEQHRHHLAVENKALRARLAEMDSGA